MSRSTVVRRSLIGFAAIVVVLVVAAAVFGHTYVRRALPTVSGELRLPGLHGKVEVLRDEHGIPQLYGDSVTDLMRAQGYVHAQDRFFEMDLRRHVTAGRLSELVGAAGFESDRVIRTMGWRQVAEAELPLLQPRTRQYLQSYADGVNEWIRTHSGANASLEYGILGLEHPGYSIEDWTPVDSLAWLKAMAWDLRGDYDDELTRARLSGRMTQAQILQLYPAPDLAERPPILDPSEWRPAVPRSLTRSALPAAFAATPPSATDDGPTVMDAAWPEQAESPRAHAAFDSTAQALAALPPLLGRGEGIGSNSWVVSGAHTTTGKPILANDPHLGIGIPGIWYQVGLHCRTLSPSCDLDVSGFSFAGMPGVVIGHTQRIAWGFTNLGPDVTDFALEVVNDNGEYLIDGAWKPVRTRTETIKVAGAADRQITVRSTGGGPILSDVLPGVADAGSRAPVPGADNTAGGSGYAVSLRWTGLAPMKTADALIGFNLATTFDEFRAAAKDFAVPAQNLVYADVDGHIGYQTPGAIPIRNPAIGTIPGFWPVPGWDSRYAWRGYVPFEQLPFAVDPKDGVVVAANQTVSASARPFLTTEWDQGYRSTRIAELVAAKPKLSVADMAAIQLDTRNEFAPELVKVLLSVDLEGDGFTGSARDLLRDWDFTNPAEGKASAAAAYFNAVWANLLENVHDDEVPADLRATGGGRWFAVMSNLLQNPKSAWWDDKQTASITEGRDEILRRSLVEARLELTRTLGKNPQDWRWGALHRLDLVHKVLGGESVPRVFRWMFNDTGTMVGGGSSIVDATSWRANEGFGVTSAPSMRMVVDLADLDASTWVQLTGNSGHAFSPHYTDQLEAWARGDQFPWPSSPKAVRAATEDTLVLVPSS